VFRICPKGEDLSQILKKLQNRKSNQIQIIEKKLSTKSNLHKFSQNPNPNPKHIGITWNYQLQ
jgi:hypothetical protein